MILTIFLRVHLRKRAAEDGEILRENIGRTAVDQAVTGDEPVAVDHLFLHAEVLAAVADQLVHFLKRAFVEQQTDTLARGELALFVLTCAALFAASRIGDGMTPAQFFEPIRHKIVE